MDKDTKEKIQKYLGWDFCEHETIRMFCGKCKLDVPAIWRKKYQDYMEKSGQLRFKLKT